MRDLECYGELNCVVQNQESQRSVFGFGGARALAGHRIQGKTKAIEKLTVTKRSILLQTNTVPIYIYEMTLCTRFHHTLSCAIHYSEEHLDPLDRHWGLPVSHLIRRSTVSGPCQSPGTTVRAVNWPRAGASIMPALRRFLTPVRLTHSSLLVFLRVTRQEISKSSSMSNTKECQM